MSPAPDGLALDKRPLPNDSHLRQIPSSSAFVISHTGFFFFPLAITRLEKIKSTPCGSLFSLLPYTESQTSEIKSTGRRPPRVECRRACGRLAGRDEGLEDGERGEKERRWENVLGGLGGVEKSRGNFSTFTLIPKCVGGKT